MIIKIPEIMPLQLQADVEANISTTLSTQIIIQAQHSDGNYYSVGAVRNFHVTQTRRVNREEVYKDGYVKYEFVPGPTETIINLERTVFDSLTMTEAFGRDFRSIQSQQSPFNIQVVESHENNNTISTYHNCWFTAMSTPIKAESYVILEQATLVCEYISTRRE